MRLPEGLVKGGLVESVIESGLVESGLVESVVKSGLIESVIKSGLVESGLVESLSRRIVKQGGNDVLHLVGRLILEPRQPLVYLRRRKVKATRHS